MVNVGSKLYQLRQKHNVKQNTIAILLEVAQSKISNIERNLIFLNTKQISILADFFKVSPSFFFEDGEPIQSSESEEYFKRIQAILTDIRQISETVKQQLLCLSEAWWYNKTILCQ